MDVPTDAPRVLLWHSEDRSHRCELAMCAAHLTEDYRAIGEDDIAEHYLQQALIDHSFLPIVYRLIGPGERTCCLISCGSDNLRVEARDGDIPRKGTYFPHLCDALWNLAHMNPDIWSIEDLGLTLDNPNTALTRFGRIVPVADANPADIIWGYADYSLLDPDLHPVYLANRFMRVRMNATPNQRLPAYIDARLVIPEDAPDLDLANIRTLGGLILACPRSVRLDRLVHLHILFIEKDNPLDFHNVAVIDHVFCGENVERVHLSMKTARTVHIKATDTVRLPFLTEAHDVRIDAPSVELHQLRRLADLTLTNRVHVFLKCLERADALDFPAAETVILPCAVRIKSLCAPKARWIAVPDKTEILACEPHLPRRSPEPEHYLYLNGFKENEGRLLYRDDATGNGEPTTMQPGDIYSEHNPTFDKSIEDDKVRERRPLWSSADGTHSLTALTSSQHMAEDLLALGFTEHHARLMSMTPAKRVFRWDQVCMVQPNSTFSEYHALAGPTGTLCLVITTPDSARILAPTLPVTTDQPFAPYLCQALPSIPLWTSFHTLEGFAQPTTGQVLTTSGTIVPAENADPLSILAGRVHYSKYSPDVFERLAKARFLTTVLDVPSHDYILPAHVAGTLDLPPDSERCNLSGLVSAGGLVVRASHSIHADKLRHLHRLHCTASPRIYAHDLASIDHITATDVEYLNIDAVTRVKSIVASGGFISMFNLTDAEYLYLNVDHLHMPLLRIAHYIDTGRTTSVFLPRLDNTIRITCPNASSVILPRGTSISELVAPVATRLVAPAKGVSCANRQLVIDRETPTLDLMLTHFNPYGYELHSGLEAFRFRFPPSPTSDLDRILIPQA